MLLKKISFIISLLILVLSTSSINKAQPTEQLKERIRKASSFSDVFVLKKKIVLSKPSGAIIQKIEELLPLEDDKLLLLILGKGIYKTLLYDTKGNFINPVGEAGYDESDYFTPSSIALDKQGNILIFDPPNKKVLLFTKENEYLKTIILSRPGDNIQLNSRGEIFLNIFAGKEDKNECIIKYSPDGKKISEFGIFPDEAGNLDAPFIRSLFCIDKKDFIYETQSFWSHIRKYNSAGILVSEFGDKTIKMNSIRLIDGSLRPYLRSAERLLIFNDLLFILFDDKLIDIYDLEGELIKKNLANNNELVYSTDKGIYAVTETAEGSVILKFSYNE